MDAIDYSAAITPDQWAELDRIETKVVPGRSCGTCSLCCKVLRIPELDKAAGEWCRHCRPGRGCGIHAIRPFVCRGAYCEWMIAKGLGPEWKPERAKFALFVTNGGRRLTAHVDPGSPSAWRRSPYYENFKQWAREGIGKSPEMHLVDVMVSARTIVVLPDRDVDLGIVPEGQTISLVRRATPNGDAVDVHVERQEAAPEAVMA
jgi:hypothetical protein